VTLIPDLLFQVEAVSPTDMKLIIVDKNQFFASDDMDDALVSYAVDSAIVVALYDPAAQVGGLLRFTEPDSRADLSRSKQMPAKYADSGMAALLDEVSRLGAAKPRLTVRLAGGAEGRSAGASGAGKKNYLAIRKNLWKLGVFVHSEDVGGQATRDVRLEIDTGRFWAGVIGSDGGLLREDGLGGGNQCRTGS
jgi:chemotaxis protein CheD